MYLRIKFACDCGARFEIDNDHSQNRVVVCPNCKKEAVDTSIGSAYQNFMNSANALNFPDWLKAEKINLNPR